MSRFWDTKIETSKGPDENPVKTSTILEQELRSWVGKIGFGIGLHFIRVGNTLFHSTVPAAKLASVEVWRV
jgi:hypothetical protein